MTIDVYYDRICTAPQQLRPGTLPTFNMRHTDSYPDANEWVVTYDNELKKLNREHNIDRSRQMPLGAKPFYLIHA